MALINEIYLSDHIPQSNQVTNPQNHKNSCIEHKSYKIKAKFTPKTKMKLILLSIKLQNERRYDYLLNQCCNLNHALITKSQIDQSLDYLLNQICVFRIVRGRD